MNKCLVTGGAGAIGLTLVKKLLDCGYEVVILDDLSSGHQFNIDPRANFIEGDISDPKTISEIFEVHKFTYVFHLAALFANQNSVDHPDKDLMVNGMGSMMLMREAGKQFEAGILKQFLYSSSSCVYGMFDGIVPETAAFHPETPYAITKLLGEYYLKYFHDKYGMPYTCFRLFNSYGPGELPGKYRNVVPNFIQLALEGKPLQITGTGDETRDFTFVEDGINGFILAMGNEKAFGKTYNIATGVETKIIDLARKIISFSDSSSEIIFKPKRDWDGVTRRCGDISAIKNDLGYAPELNLDQGLPKTIEWIRKMREKEAHKSHDLAL